MLFKHKNLRAPGIESPDVVVFLDPSDSSHSSSMTIITLVFPEVPITQLLLLTVITSGKDSTCAQKSMSCFFQQPSGICN